MGDAKVAGGRLVFRYESIYLTLLLLLLVLRTLLILPIQVQVSSFQYSN